MRLFRKSSTKIKLPIPGILLVEDAETPELVYLRELEDETGHLDAPLATKHTRGKALLPAQKYHTDAQGNLHIMLRQTGKLAVFFEGNLQHISLESKENSLTVLV